MEPNLDNSSTNSIGKKPRVKRISRVKVAGIFATLIGAGIFVYYIYSVGPRSVIEGAVSIGACGFALILFIHGSKLLIRATAWHLTLYGPHSLRIKDTFPAVIIGEALSTVVPMGILMSGTAKAVAVRKKVPIVVGLASVVTENLFYSLITGLFITIGAIAFIRQFALPPPFDLFIDAMIALLIFAMIVGVTMVIRQWHWASGFCDILYRLGIFTRILGNGRLHVRMFENLIYGFYRTHPKRFLPLCGLQILFHSLGVLEVWFILTRISGSIPAAIAAFYLETMSRLVTVVFKLVPFLIGIDEASAEFVVEALGIGAGVGVTLAVVRKAKVIVWALAGFSLILKRGLSLREVREIQQGRLVVEE